MLQRRSLLGAGLSATLPVWATHPQARDLINLLTGADQREVQFFEDRIAVFRRTGTLSTVMDLLVVVPSFSSLPPMKASTPTMPSGPTAAISTVAPF